ncbi:glycosyltransferase [Sphingomonas sp. KRR8]|uniref:glycosyltransferase n=1 Tax=Sphingomonas sp. KRR8 TaxID=2942996 RepID=UPI00201FEA0E|nr:glycosyltransferase [Sphingomonas sp. KRR8]URD59962.1 glycosyltransferase [Sphingomonas sp. KRR8]
MRIVDVCAFYTPHGGGVKTYLERKLEVATALGHEMILLAPGAEDGWSEVAPGAVIATLRNPELPVDRRYHYFADEAALHGALDHWRPDHVEASSPWSSATHVGRWQGAATRSLVMHADPLASYAYRWFGKVAERKTIDRWFNWFWRHLRGLDGMYDLVVSANQSLSERLRAGGLKNVATVPMGVEPDTFSPSLRDEGLREELLCRLGLPRGATLLLGLGRFAAEKRWAMVMRAVEQTSASRPVGLLLVGDGNARAKLEKLAANCRHVSVGNPIRDRDALATLLASADALVHGCESETFCMAAAEARASGLPLIVPDFGGAASHYLAGAGQRYVAADRQSLSDAIVRFVDGGPGRARALAGANATTRTMDDHFVELFDRYRRLGGSLPAEIMPRLAALA